MKLTVLGSRANIEVRSRWHRQHAVLRVTYLGCDVQFDCGLDWLRHRATFPPRALLSRTPILNFADRNRVTAATSVRGLGEAQARSVR